MNIFTPLNDLIKIIYDANLSLLVYWMWHIINLAVFAVFCLVYSKHYNIKKSYAVIAPFMIYLLGLLTMLLIGWIESGFTHFGDNNAVKGFCFVPLLAFIPCKLFKLDWKTLLDFSAPAFALAQAVGHLQCVFAGCCNGYPIPHGLYNPVFKMELFPSQLLECFVALIIAIVIIRIAKKQDYIVTGRLYPYFFLMFGSTRFLLEFLRANYKLFWGISELALWALLQVVIGIIMLAIDKKSPTKVVIEKKTQKA